MPLFDEKKKKELGDILKELENDVTIVYFTQEFECNTCKDTKSLLKEIAGLSDKINLDIYDFQKDSEKTKEYGIDKIPAIAILDSKNFDPGIRFYGIPAGYEINSFIKNLLEVSGKREALPENIKKRIDSIKKDIHIQVFVTLVCPYYPSAVMTAHRLALESDKIKADMVESSTFTHLALKYSVTGVPKIIINEKHDLVGAQPIDKFLDVIEKI